MTLQEIFQRHSNATGLIETRSDRVRLTFTAPKLEQPVVIEAQGNYAYLPHPVDVAAEQRRRQMRPDNVQAGDILPPNAFALAAAKAAGQG